MKRRRKTRREGGKEGGREGGRKKKEGKKGEKERKEKDSHLGENGHLREKQSGSHMLGSKCVSTCERQYIIDLP